MKTKTYNVFFVFVAVFFLKTLCYGGILDSNNKDGNVTNIHIMLKNIGSKEIVDSSVKLGDNLVRGGIIPPGKSKTHLFFNQPVKDIAVVAFEKADKEKIEKTVDCKNGNFKKQGEHLTIIFSINTDNNDVSVSFFNGLTAK